MTDAEVQEYEQQLAGIEELLQLTPDDEALLALKKDLVELLQLTKGGDDAAAPSATAEESDDEEEDDDDEDGSETDQATASAKPASDTADAATDVPSSSAAANDDDKNDSKDKKKAKKKKRKTKSILDEKFEIPEHLIPLDTDTDAEKNKKRRTAKGLKSKFRAKRKEAESAHKQKTWQSFLTKGKKVKKPSMFSTAGDADAKVGVASKKTLTEFGSRKRHKQA